MCICQLSNKDARVADVKEYIQINNRQKILGKFVSSVLAIVKTKALG